MKYLRRYNESNKFKVSNDVLSYLKGIDHDTLKVVISDLEKELQKDKPDTSKLMAYADDISVISDELELDSEKVDTIYDEIYSIVRERDEEDDEEEFLRGLPPEEGGQGVSYRLRDLIVSYEERLSDLEEYDKDYDDLVGLSDEDYHSAGELSGKVKMLKEIIKDLKDIRK